MCPLIKLLGYWNLVALFFFSNFKLCEINWNGCSERFLCGVRSTMKGLLQRMRPGRSLKADKDGLIKTFHCLIVVPQ